MTSIDKHDDPQPSHTTSAQPPSDPSQNGEPSRTRIRATSPEDILAYIECTLGFRPSDSLVMVATSGSQLSTVVRCDLPNDLQNMLQSDTPESVTFMDFGITEQQELQFMDLGRRLGHLLNREPSTTKCLLLYLPTDVGVSDHHALAVVGTANAMISAQFGLQRVPVEEAWLIHHHALWHLRCAATTDCDIQGIALGDPKAAPLYDQLAPAGTSTHHTATQRRQLSFPPTLRQQAEPVQQCADLSAPEPRTILTWLQRWDQRLTNGRKMMDTQEVERLLQAIRVPSLRDAVLAIACFGMSAGVIGMARLGRLPAAVSQDMTTPDDDAAAVDVHECFKGQSQRTPDWRRIGELEQLCLQLLPLSDAASCAHLTGVLIWIEWVRGRGSIALHYVQQAVEYFPQDPFLKRYEGMLYQGMVAQWATRKDSAWTPQHAG